MIAEPHLDEMPVCPLRAKSERVLRLQIWRNRRIVVVPEKGTIHGTRPQYFSNGFSRSNYRDEHRRLGRIQEICVTRKRRECPLLTQSEHQRPSISSRLS